MNMVEPNIMSFLFLSMHLAAAICQKRWKGVRSPFPSNITGTYQGM
ncbi:hypothetical protein SLEP1_g58849 [Rubroshorea leprosula]|uniref:Uncharacterized protein n=1 Tax=Rubroshorea leprosula TaxID=152421 RepID=A0AAV5MQQ1_9ROSI|nr:hypothetical protein SLEP1_g58849 [Rubroshorea leprosula]